MVYYKVSQPSTKLAGLGHSNTANSLYANAMEISVGHRTGQLLDLGATKMNGFLEIVMSQNKIIGRYRRSTGYVGAKLT